MGNEHSCAIVGPARTRNGLGPFLAHFLEQAGVSVLAAAGRDSTRTRSECAALSGRLGHDVLPFIDVLAMLDTVRPDALVIAAPPVAHLPALRVAERLGVHVLCEKPFVRAAETGVVDSLLDAFAAKGCLVVENCQWPFVLPAFSRLFPVGSPARRVAMRLSPSATGRAMVEDSLSHLLSLIQAVGVVDRWTHLADVAVTPHDPSTESMVLEFALRGPSHRIDARLELQHAAVQPRTAWIEIDGARAERRVRVEDYGMQLVALDGRAVPVADPLGELVYGFARDLAHPTLDRAREHSGRIRERARLYGALLGRIAP